MPRTVEDREGACLTVSTLSYSGGSIWFEIAAITWTNPLSLYFETTQRFDFELLNGSDRTSYWRWSDGQTFDPTSEVVVVQPKTPKVFAIELIDPLPSGIPQGTKIILKGTLCTETMPFVGELEFTIDRS